MAEAPGYYNTNDEKGATLEASRSKAKGQEAAILAYFKARPGVARTSRQLVAIFKYERTDVTRSLRNLVLQDELEKSDKPDFECGWTHKLVHTWRLAVPPPTPEPKQEPLF